MSKSMYATMLDELTTKIKVGAKDGRKPTCSYSKSDLDNLTLAMLNSPEHVVTEYQMKVSDIQFTKEHASSMMSLCTCVLKDYIRAGRKFSFPITAPDECRMEFYCDTAPERINQNRVAKTEEEKKKVSKTLERTVLKSKNSVPSWLKTEK